METKRVLVTEKLSENGLGILKAAAPAIETEVKVGLKKPEILAIIDQYQALIVRSATQVDAELIDRASRMLVIGRAGIGVDNIDVPAATSRGILVMNTPEGNVVTTAEHAISLLCSLARKIPQATASMRAGAWEKSKFQGRELFNKVIGVVGLGNIGKVVADRALGLKMRVVAFDPFVTSEKAKELGVELCSLEELLARSHFVTLHVPLVEGTRNIIDKKAIERMLPGAFLINAARGGLCDEAAVAEAVKAGRLGGAAFDVFLVEPPRPDNPLLSVENVILTPHLGASTSEAQENVAVAVAAQVVDFLKTGAGRNAVNAPNISSELLGSVSPYRKLATKIGSMAGQLHKGGLKKVRMIHAGGASELPFAPIKSALLAGLLASRIDRINEVNAPLVAKERGITIVEERSDHSDDFASSIGLSVEGDEGKIEIIGSLAASGEGRIVKVNGMILEIIPRGAVLVTEHQDRPGIIGRLGTIFGDHQINISRLALGLAERGAMAAISLDSTPSEAVLSTVRNIPGFQSAVLINFR